MSKRHRLDSEQQALQTALFHCLGFFFRKTLAGKQVLATFAKAGEPQAPLKPDTMTDVPPRDRNGETAA